MKKIKTIIFDYDGTIHESIKVYAPAFREAYKYLVKNGFAKDKEWTDKEISVWLGYTSTDMWNEFMPELKGCEKENTSKIIGKTMIDIIRRGNAVLYDGAIDVLSYLKNKGYSLIILSNCKTEYLELHNKIFSLDKYFDELICTQKFNYKPKYEVFNYIKDKYPSDYVVIGDRYHDIEIKKHHDIKAIACTYGYGKTEEFEIADILISNIEEIKKYL